MFAEQLAVWTWRSGRDSSERKHRNGLGSRALVERQTLVTPTLDAVNCPLASIWQSG